jgi:hypothetical protein
VTATRWLLAWVVLASASCAGAFGAGSTRRANQVGLGAAAAALACDGGQTMNAAIRYADADAAYVAEEGFLAAKVIGRRPGPVSVALYFVVGSAALLGLARLVPERLRPAAYAGVALVEAYVVAGNYSRGRIPVCGIW